MAISFLESAARTSHYLGVGVNDGTVASIVLKSKTFQPLVMTTENITKPGFVVSTSKMSKDARLSLNVSYDVDYFLDDSVHHNNYIVENKYSVPKVVKDYGYENRTAIHIVSRENMPGMTECSSFSNAFTIDMTGIAKSQDIDSVTCIFNSGAQETHRFVSNTFLSNSGAKFTLAPLFKYSADFKAADDSVFSIRFETPGESKRTEHRNFFIISAISDIKRELSNRLNYPNGQPNLFGLLSECTIVVRSKTGGVIYETKLPKITPSNDFVYYYIEVSARVNGNKCTLTNPPSWYKGPTTLDFERQSLTIPL